MRKPEIRLAPGAGFSVHREDWSLHRQGERDQQRHREKVKEAIRSRLADLVAEESIITSDGQRIVKVPIRSLQEYRFRFGEQQGGRPGQGPGGSKVGDLVAPGDGAGAGPGKGPGAGEQEGVDYYEAEVTVDELAEMLFADLGLPNLDPKRRDEMVADEARWDDVRRHGMAPNIDRRRTLKEALLRRAMERSAGDAAAHVAGVRLTPRDLRYRTWNEAPKPRTSAVVLAMMDTSGSMGHFQKYMARSFFFWATRFLRTRYPEVRIVFIAHDVLAREVSEDDFFRKGESGGTRCSSAFRLALDVVADRFPPAHYSIYPFHFSDGDNLPSDNEQCLALARELAELSQQLGYAEVNPVVAGETTLWRAFDQLRHPRFERVRMTDKDELLPALRRFFRPDDGRWQGVGV